MLRKMKGMYLYQMGSFLASSPSQIQEECAELSGSPAAGSKGGLLYLAKTSVYITVVSEGADIVLKEEPCSGFCCCCCCCCCCQQLTHRLSIFSTLHSQESTDKPFVSGFRPFLFLPAGVETATKKWGGGGGGRNFATSHQASFSNIKCRRVRRMRRGI